MSSIVMHDLSQHAAVRITSKPGRQPFLDNLKVFLVILVIFHHAGQPYGPTGGAWPVMHAEKFRWLAPFFHINASFFMGLFFLISGYFVAASYDRKGARDFLIERFQRFGIPVLVFAGAFVPLVRHVFVGKPWADCFLPFDWAHLWFLGHLLVYGVAYVLLRKWRPDATPPSATNATFPSNRMLFAYALALCLVSFVVRLWFPIDRWVKVGVPAELAHFPQYLSLFVFGVMSGPRRWLERIPARTGRIWLAVGIAMIVLRLTYSLTLPGFLRVDALWVDLVWNLWEAVLCVGMCIGLLYAFREFGAADRLWTRFLGRHAFAMYVVHLPILVFIQIALERSAFGPLTLTLLSGSLTVGLSCAVAAAYALCKASLAPKNGLAVQGET